MSDEGLTNLYENKVLLAATTSLEELIASLG
jgi:hypothetical protein